MARRARLCRSRGPMSVPAGTLQQPDRLFDRSVAGGISRRHRGVDRLHPALRRAPRALCVWRNGARWPRGVCAGAWPEAGRGRDRRAGRLGHGEDADPGPAARLDCRSGRGHHCLEHVAPGANRRHPAGGCPGLLALPDSAGIIAIPIAVARFANRRHRSIGSIRAPLGGASRTGPAAALPGNRHVRRLLPVGRPGVRRGPRGPAVAATSLRRSRMGDR